jgi:glutamyl-tRNA reductase
MFNYKNLPKLRKLCDQMSCIFIDAQSTSKNYVSNTRLKWNDKLQTTNGFLVSTCLRLEMYDFSANNLKNDNFFYAEKITCVRRFLSLLVGLQSEIIGEREILSQVIKSIGHAFCDGQLSKDIFKELQELLFIAQYIRTNFNVETLENYSTIGARIVQEYIKNKKDAKVVIIGGGYMSESFLTELTSLSTYNLLWINRDIAKIIKKFGEINTSSDIKVDFSALEGCEDKIKDADVIFCAISNSPDYFKDIKLNKDSVIIDISYPQVFGEQQKAKLINISNTFFNRLVVNPIPKTNIVLANKEIDKIINQIYSYDL